MFSDELQGNASRRRQEQSKARRRKLKEQKLKSQSKAKEDASPADNKVIVDDGNNSEKKILQLKSNDKIDVSNTTTGASASSSSSSAKNSAVAKAIEQRKVRSYQKLHNTSATIIQASYRAYKSNITLKQRQRSLLEKRIGDLVTLSLLLRKQNKNYVPPPSLVNLMVNQMLFVLHTTARYRKVPFIVPENDGAGKQFFLAYFASISDELTKKDGENASRLIEFAILPGLLSSDDHLDPSLQWLESKEGRIKFQKMLRLCSHLILARQGMASSSTSSLKKKVHGVSPLVTSENDMSNIYKLLSCLLGFGGSNDKQSARRCVVAFCIDILLPAVASSVPKPFRLGQKPIQMESLDLIHILRSFLLYPSSQRVQVIPSHAERTRRNCISDLDRLRATGLFSLLSDTIRTTGAGNRNDSLQLMSRFVAEIFTVPLLTWRIEQTEVDKLVGNGAPFMRYVSAFFRIRFAQGLTDCSDMKPSADVPLKLCPSPPVLSLCANIVSLGTSCPLINGIDRASFDPDGEMIVLLTL